MAVRGKCVEVLETQHSANVGRQRIDNELVVMDVSWSAE
jgi:hypothetical protein